MHVFLQYLTPVSPCVFVSCRPPLSVPPCFLSVLSLCLQEEGVVSFCKVCALGLVNSSFPPFTERYVKSTPSPPPRAPRHPPRSCASHPAPSPTPETPPAACATEHTESELPIMPLGGPLLTIAGTLGIVAQPTQSHLYF